tara:strand:+ start:188 stop:364 length:177 start_codon:yes stop_codon:yes gene_type:complete
LLQQTDQQVAASQEQIAASHNYNEPNFNQLKIIMNQSSTKKYCQIFVVCFKHIQEKIE